ncbi:MAG: adenosylcobinamide-GDP ribazoletransferase [Candidatus Omnitrophica bacterium]|nr:adenosylcobinamide-GDP ribazoletransferase [Candidatus Omnitrophota bacterium]
MKSFLLALQFLTIIPVRIKHIDDKKISSAITYFPLVGLFLGLILTGADRFLSFLGLEEFFINIILVVLLIILTGGLHLDGLADTSDAFLSRKNKEDMLRIMRDSRIGAMGVLGLVSIVLLKIAFLSSISVSLKPMSLLLTCVLARWALVLSLFLFPYARQDGKAKAFIEGANPKVFILSTLITLCCAVFLWRFYGVLILIVIAAITGIMGKFIMNKIGGITGDTLGATNEIIELLTLVSICLLERVLL